MSGYKIYILDEKGHITLSYNFQGPDDLSALEESKKHSNNSAIEVWSGSRLVACIEQVGRAATG